MAILNLEYYTQKDLYSDGDIDEKMLKMAKEGVTCEGLSSEQVSFPVMEIAVVKVVLIPGLLGILLR